MRKIFWFCFSLILFSCNRGEVSNYTSYLNHNDTVKYVGKEECRTCHIDIYDSYMQTGMGKSFHFATKENSALTNSDMYIIHDSIKNLSYQPFWKNDSLYLKEFRVKNGDTTHKLIKKITYKIGSGHHTNSHLFEINGYVHQMPYTYYTQDSLADLPPGYENGKNSRFSREIGLECMSCHNAYPIHESTSINKFESIPNGIDCERCHGPGEAHIKQKLAGNIIDTSKFIDYSIVNPGKLPTDLLFDVCQRCHLQGTAVLAEGKSFLDFKPGNHLKEIMDIYLPKYENDNSFIMASHVERLKESACFKSSEMTCISCHNPHKSVTTTSSSYFDAKCMKCHDLCNEEENTNNCTSCHMPTSSSSDIPHVSITDHKIGIHNKKSKSEKGKFLGLFAINNKKPSNLSKAKAYLKRYESFEGNPVYLDSAKYYMDKLLIKESYPLYIQYHYLQENYKAIVNLSMQYLELEYLENNTTVKALCLSRKGESFSIYNLDEQALSHFQQASKLAPNVLDYQLKLGVQLVKMKDYLYAKKIFKDILKEYPLHKESLVNLGYLSILNKEFNVAENYLKQAIALDPDYLQAFENLVLSSQMQNKTAEMKLYLKKILEIAPNHKAKEILKNL